MWVFRYTLGAVQNPRTFSLSGDYHCAKRNTPKALVLDRNFVMYTSYAVAFLAGGLEGHPESTRPSKRGRLRPPDPHRVSPIL
jgi:hypothetical protein